ncbi:unnamed protein product, partial [Nesidiocoris tenuis]
MRGFTVIATIFVSTPPPCSAREVVPCAPARAARQLLQGGMAAAARRRLSFRQKAKRRRAMGGGKRLKAGPSREGDIGGTRGQAVEAYRSGRSETAPKCPPVSLSLLFFVVRSHLQPVVTLLLRRARPVSHLPLGPSPPLGPSARHLTAEQCRTRISVRRLVGTRHSKRETEAGGNTREHKRQRDVEDSPIRRGATPRVREDRPKKPRRRQRRPPPPEAAVPSGGGGRGRAQARTERHPPPRRSQGASRAKPPRAADFIMNTNSLLAASFLLTPPPLWHLAPVTECGGRKEVEEGTWGSLLQE